MLLPLLSAATMAVNMAVNVTLVDGAAIAYKASPGRVLEVDLLRDEDAAHWSVVLVRGGVARVVSVDAESGEVIRIARVESPKEKLGWMRTSRIGVTQATQTALKWRGGKAIEAELQWQEGRPVWEIDILDRLNKKHEVLVDGRGGWVIKVD